jgi:hypothetical protein
MIVLEKDERCALFRATRIQFVIQSCKIMLRLRIPRPDVVLKIMFLD